jgi:hypothetical protein
MPERTTHVCRAAPWRGLAVVVAAIVAAACSDGDSDLLTASTPAPATAATTTAAPATTVETASTTETATAPESSVAPNTFPPASSTPEPPPPVELSGPTLELASPYMSNPFLLERIGTFGELVVYDGETVDGDFALRCVAVGKDGGMAWSEWCALPGESATFVVVDGADPWVAEVGIEPGDVVLNPQPPTWAVTSSGCVDPLVMLIDAAELGPAVATGVACAGGEAFLTYSSVFMQPGPVDGGGTLLTQGDEGWNSQGGGTSVACDQFLDGVDRCEQFGVESELFEAASPFPSPAMLPAQTDFVGVRDVTGELRWILAGLEETADIDTISEAILAGVATEDGEVEPTMTRYDDVSFNRFSLLIVDVPLADDSVRSTTSVAWITTPVPDEPSTIHRAFAWETCSRGMASATTCV